MKSLASLALALGISLAAVSARADVGPPDPCESLKEGASCTTADGASGTCKPIQNCMGSGCLECVESSGTGGSDGGGCSVGAVRRSGALPFAILALVAAIPLLRRRRLPRA